MTTTLRDLSGGDAAGSPARRSAILPRTSLTEHARRELTAYATAVVGVVVAVFLLMKLWRADLAVPFAWTGDAVSSAAHVKATVQWGWYEKQPNLGAPYGQQYHDYPFGDNLPLVFAKVAGWFTDNWPLIFNFYFLLGSPLAAVTALWFARRCGVSRPLAVAVGILFALAPYHWLRGESHFYLSGYWLVPVGLWAALTVLRGESLWTGSAREKLPPVRRAIGLLNRWNIAFAFGLAALATSAAYYAVFAGILIGIAGVTSLIRTRGWERFVGAAVAGALLMSVVVLNILPDLLYQQAQGQNPDGFARVDGDPEIYALKIVSLLLPVPGHRIPILARLRGDYDTSFPLPSEQPALGLVAAIGLLCALGLMFAAATRPMSIGASDRPRRSVTPRAAMATSLAVLTVLMVLMSTVGGLGTILSSLSTGLRGWNRMSILIMLACLTLIGLLVDAGISAVAARVRGHASSSRRRCVAAIFITTIGVLDQSPGSSVPDYAAVRTSWDSDNAFVRDVERQAGANAMLFQTPFIGFPESPPLFDAGDSEVVKLSLLSDTLRWSGGGIKGRPRSDWSLVVNRLPPDQLTAAAAEMGFTGIVLNTKATPDGGVAAGTGLTAVLGEPTVASSDGHWIYFALAPVVAAVDARTTPEERAAFVQLMLTDPDQAWTQISLG